MPTRQRQILSRWRTLTAAPVYGVLQAQLEPPAPDNVVLVDTVVLAANPYVPCQAFLHFDDASSPAINQSANAGMDVFEGTLEVPGGHALVITWSGEVGASVLTARIHLTLFETVLVPNFGSAITTWRG